MQGLILHRGGYEVTREQLASLPIPESLGRNHKPVPHVEVLDALDRAFPDFGLEKAEEGWGVSADASKLFGVIRFNNKTQIEGTDLLLGIRTSVDESIALQGVAGARVFVCDNMAFSGQEFLFKRKSTTNANMVEVIYEGMERFEGACLTMEQTFKRFQEHELDTDAASRLFADMVCDEVVPDKYITRGVRAYFDWEPEQTDVAPRTVWGLYNAMTRGLREVAVNAKLQHTQAVTRFLKAAA